MKVFFHFGQILFYLTTTFAVHREKRFVPALFKVCLYHLFDNLESGKRIYCFRKKFGSLEFWIRKSVQTLITLGLKWNPLGYSLFFNNLLDGQSITLVCHLLKEKFIYEPRFVLAPQKPWTS